jgi:hypothetical protein
MVADVADVSKMDTSPREQPASSAPAAKTIHSAAAEIVWPR